jgi:hypothetical protein
MAAAVPAPAPPAARPPWTADVGGERSGSFAVKTATIKVLTSVDQGHVAAALAKLELPAAATDADACAALLAAAYAVNKLKAEKLKEFVAKLEAVLAAPGLAPEPLAFTDAQMDAIFAAADMAFKQVAAVDGLAGDALTAAAGRVAKVVLYAGSFTREGLAAGAFVLRDALKLKHPGAATNQVLLDAWLPTLPIRVSRAAAPDGAGAEPAPRADPVAMTKALETGYPTVLARLLADHPTHTEMVPTVFAKLLGIDKGQLNPMGFGYAAAVAAAKLGARPAAEALDTLRATAASKLVALAQEASRPSQPALDLTDDGPPRLYSASVPKELIAARMRAIDRVAKSLGSAKPADTTLLDTLESRARAANGVSVDHAHVVMHKAIRVEFAPPPYAALYLYNDSIALYAQVPFKVIGAVKVILDERDVVLGGQTMAAHVYASKPYVSGTVRDHRAEVLRELKVREDVMRGDAPGHVGVHYAFCHVVSEHMVEIANHLGSDGDALDSTHKMMRCTTVGVYRQLCGLAADGFFGCASETSLDFLRAVLNDLNVELASGGGGGAAARAPPRATGAASGWRARSRQG